MVYYYEFTNCMDTASYTNTHIQELLNVGSRLFDHEQKETQERHLQPSGLYKSDWEPWGICQSSYIHNWSHSFVSQHREVFNQIKSKQWNKEIKLVSDFQVWTGGKCENWVCLSHVKNAAGHVWSDLFTTGNSSSFVSIAHWEFWGIIPAVFSQSDTATLGILQCLTKSS